MGRKISKIICLAFTTALLSGLSKGVHEDDPFRSEEDEGVQVLNQNNTFEKAVEFVDFVISSVASMNTRIETLEQAKHVKELEARILTQSIQIENLIAEMEILKNERQPTTIPSTPTALIETPVMPTIQTTPESITLSYRSAEEYLEYLRSHRYPAKGRSFNGSTLEEISAAVPLPWALTIEIVNYRGLSLHGYKINLAHGVAVTRAPEDVPPNTREVFTFQQNRIQSYYPEGISVYRIGGTDLSVHLYFASRCATDVCRRGFAVALLPNQDSEFTLSKSFSDSYHHEGPVGSFEQISRSDVAVHNVTAITVHRNNIYAKATFKTEEEIGLIILEVFEFPF